MVTVVQAVPAASVDVYLDGRRVAAHAEIGDVLGPFEMAAGPHEIAFAGEGLSVDSTLDVAAGAAQDVVLHLPANVGGKPVIHTYATPDGPIGPGKARVLLAHTATVPPADVEVDGQIVFTNIANGEFAEADVPAGTIAVALLPSGSSGDPILGPLDVSLARRTISMIYAYGNPRNSSMNVVAHTAELAADGSIRPSRIDTGSAGLITDPVTTIEPTGAGPAVALLGGLAVAALAGAFALRRRRKPAAGVPLAR